MGAGVFIYVLVRPKDRWADMGAGAAVGCAGRSYDPGHCRCERGERPISRPLSAPFSNGVIWQETGCSAAPCQRVICVKDNQNARQPAGCVALELDDRRPVCVFGEPARLGSATGHRAGRTRSPARRPPTGGLVRSRSHTHGADPRHVWTSTWPRPAGHVRCGLRQSARRRPSRLEVLVQPRRACARCRRSIAVKQDGTMRSHFCPHYRSCEPGCCVDCAAPATADWPQGAQLAEPPLTEATRRTGAEPRS